MNNRLEQVNMADWLAANRGNKRAIEMIDNILDKSMTQKERYFWLDVQSILIDRIRGRNGIYHHEIGRMESLLDSLDKELETV